MRSELLQGRKTEPLRVFGINGKTIWNIENLKKPLVGTIVRYLDHIVQIDTSHEAPAEKRGRYNNLVYLRGIEKNCKACR